MKILIAGLGNPGNKFTHTRHNTGFMAIDKIAANFRFPIFPAWRDPGTRDNFQSNFNAQISNGVYENQKIILAKPQTFMNESGKAIKAIADYYKISIDNIIIIHDDLDISLGKYKIVRDRSSAGHKGVQSIINELGTKDFFRIRIGITPLTGQSIPAENFVLKKFTKDEQKIIDEIIEKVCKEIETIIKK